MAKKTYTEVSTGEKFQAESLQDLLRQVVAYHGNSIYGPYWTITNRGSFIDVICEGDFPIATFIPG
jgi:hypothetical protein